MFRHSLNASSGDFEPSRFYLGQNYPNPFRERTAIKYCVAYRTRVQLTLCNPAGEEIEKLVDEEKEPGTYEVEFRVARLLEGGAYFYRLEAGDYSCEKKMIHRP